MKYKLIISEEAQADVSSITEHYFTITTILGKRFINEMRKSQKHIHTNPYTFQIRYGQVRIYFLKVYPFGLHYQLMNHAIIIFAMFHT